MCGLLGIALKTEALSNEEKAQLPYFFDQLMYLNNKRGGDSYGLALATPKGYSIYKGMGYFIARARKADEEAIDQGVKTWVELRQDLRQALQEEPWLVLMGHNRKATHGEIIMANQHPFLLKHPSEADRWILGAHNGVFSQHDLLMKAWGLREYPVDSQSILEAILQKGEDEALPEILENSTTSLSYMTKENELKLFRGGRPLATVLDKNKQILAWSSDEDHLDTAMVGFLADRSWMTLTWGTDKGKSKQLFNGAVVITLPMDEDQITPRVTGPYDAIGKGSVVPKPKYEQTRYGSRRTYGQTDVWDDPEWEKDNPFRRGHSSHKRSYTRGKSTSLSNVIPQAILSSNPKDGSTAEITCSSCSAKLKSFQAFTGGEHKALCSFCYLIEKKGQKLTSKTTQTKEVTNAKPT